jgi:hypothetical protein
VANSVVHDAFSFSLAAAFMPGNQIAITQSRPHSMGLSPGLGHSLHAVAAGRREPFALSSTER